jgi:hypothetical protein
MSIYNATPEGKVSVTRAASELRISRNLFEGWVKKGYVPSEIVGPRHYVSIEEAFKSPKVIAYYDRKKWVIPGVKLPVQPVVSFRTVSVEPNYSRGA